MSVVQIDVEGVESLQKRFVQLQTLVEDGRLVRSPMREAVKIVGNAQRDRAPVRRAYIRKRVVKKNLAKGVSRAKALRRGASPIKKFRSIGVANASGPRQLIKPGQLKRAIKYKVRISRKGFVFAKSGMNVGMKEGDRRRAPHAHLVALGTKDIRKTKNEAKRGKMPANPFISTATQMVARQALSKLESGTRYELDKALASVGAK